MTGRSDPDPFTDSDRRQLEERGISVEEAARQIDMLRHPPGFADLDRPCTIGDGIRKIAENEIPDLLAAHEEAAGAGRCGKFVPASGAASRMFKDLLHYGAGPEPITARQLAADLAEGRREALALRTFIEGLSAFAFQFDLRRAVAARGRSLDEALRSREYGIILEGLLAPDGLGYADLPKGLLKFHAYPDGSRTPFEEHLVESAALLRDEEGVCRLHFTVSPEHLQRFETLLDEVKPRYERAFDARYEVSFSVQKPSTDALALDADGNPFKRRDGGLLFRPAGHGALLENLMDAEGDVVFLKNVDNVAPDRLKSATETWARILVGCLVQAQRRAFGLLEMLASSPPDPSVVDESMDFASRSFHRPASPRDSREPPEERRARAVDALNRPIRVCGVVPAEGEAGGGPFWVRERDGTASLQIVEGAQIDMDVVEQRSILASSTHFNPVFIACGVRDREGKPFDLRRWVDPAAAIVTRKSVGGRELLALERPGLWNGAMARWNTIFVDVPGDVFTPVKTVNDLLRESHRTGF